MIRKLAFIILVMATWLSSSAYDFMVDGIAYNKNSDGNSVTVTYTELASKSNYNGGDGPLVIPEKVTYRGKEYTITGIGNWAFYGCKGFTGELNIPSSVTKIGSNAFENCSGLTGALNIPNSVSSIGYMAFYGCSGFTGDLNIPNSVKYIYSSTFECCRGLTGSLNIPNSVIEIGESAFSRSGFTGSLKIPNSVSKIGEHAFDSCSGFTGDLNIPNSVTEIGEYAFEGCSGFNGKLVIPNSVTEIRNGTFFDCRELSGTLLIPNSIKTIGDLAFDNCRGFTGSLMIPNSVIEIGESAFAGLRNCTGSLVIGDSVTSIGNNAFSNCVGFTGSLTIGKSATSIARNAFDYTRGFTELIYNATNCSSFEYTEYHVDENGDPIYNEFGEQQYSTYYLFDQIKFKSLKIGDNVKKIPVGFLYNQKELKGNLSIPNSVTSISEKAFIYCGFDGSLIIPNSVTSIGGDSFYAHHFETISISCIDNDDFAKYIQRNDIKSLFHSVLFEKLQHNIIIAGNQQSDVVIPESVACIGDYAFRNCSGLTGNLDIPNSVTEIGTSAFENCSGFNQSLTIGNSVTKIGFKAFDGCSGFTGDLNIPNSVTSIRDYAFRNCSGFTGSIIISNSVTQIGYSAFEGCSGLTGNLDIPNSVTEIGTSAFENCSGFNQSLSIGNSVTKIGSKAFLGCRGINVVKSFNNNPPIISSNTFDEETYSKPLFVNNKSVQRYKNANYWNRFGFIGSGMLNAESCEYFGGDDILFDVNMTNMSNITGFQTDIRLPEGLNFVVDNNGKPIVYFSDRATADHTLNASKLDSQSLRVTSFSDTPFNGSNGPLFTVKMKTDENSEIGEKYITIANANLFDADGSVHNIDNSFVSMNCFYVPGDANHDKQVTVSDITADARYIMNHNPAPFHFKSANINEDDEISIADIVITANVIMGRIEVPDKKFKAQRLVGNDELSASVVETRSDGSRTIAIALDNATDYTAFQADLRLPEGMEITCARLSDRAGSSHSITMNKIDGNTVRLLSYAIDNATYAGNSGNLLLIDVMGHGDINLTNALFCEPNGCEHELNEIKIITELNGINDITVGENGPVNVYNTAGQLIRTNVNPETATQGLPAGFYIVGGKKTVVK